jgi:hypothetical protein
MAAAFPFALTVAAGPLVHFTRLNWVIALTFALHALTIFSVLAAVVACALSGRGAVQAICANGVGRGSGVIHVRLSSEIISAMPPGKSRRF